jgi:hypothetical protein
VSDGRHQAALEFVDERLERRKRECLLAEVAAREAEMLVAHPTPLATDEPREDLELVERVDEASLRAPAFQVLVEHEPLSMRGRRGQAVEIGVDGDALITLLRLGAGGVERRSVPAGTAGAHRADVARADLCLVMKYRHGQTAAEVEMGEVPVEEQDAVAEVP